MSTTVRWGIIGAGNIARKFAAGIRHAVGAELLGVGSRAREKAEAFGEELSIPRRYGSYEDLAADGDVDAVYVATPHPMHKACAVLCLSAGKAVLCEKPLTTNAAEAREVVDAARRAGVFCMEGMWTRFLPAIVRMRELLAEGAVGEVRMITADFGFHTEWNPEGRLLNPHLAGGGLLDVGVYPISLASMLFGTPRRVTGLAHLGATGVDEQAGIILAYDGGRIAVIATAIRTTTPQDAWILGTEGRIRLHAPWWSSTKITLHRRGEEEKIELPLVGNGYNYEVEEVGRCLAEGLIESPTMPLDESISIMETTDRLRAQWGLKYPME